MSEDAPVNIGAPEPVWSLWGSAESRVLKIQTKLHQWAKSDPYRRFDDLFNLVADPAFLMTAWVRVRDNKGARSAGVDGQTAYYVEHERGAEAFLSSIREQLRSRTFRPLPVKERMIPKPGTRKRRRLGIPTVTDRVVQASLKLVLEPIFEADFQPCSYGFVRHEVRGIEGGGRPSRCIVAAMWCSWGQPDPGDAGEGGKQPRQRRDGLVLPDGPGSASEIRRWNVSEPAVDAP